MNRFQQVLHHLPVEHAPRSLLLSHDVKATSFDEDIPLHTRWSGWGFTDTEFELNSEGLVYLTGSRYLFSGKALPSLRLWMEESAGLNVEDATPCQPHPDVPAPIKNEEFLAELKTLGCYSKLTFGDKQRMFHGHGHTVQEIWKMRYGQFNRVPDVVIWPASHEQVEALVTLAGKHNVVIIPYGGGTTVTQSVACPEQENRMIVSLDMHEMNRVKWVDRKSMIACIEAGAVGKDIEKKLGEQGLCLGHEPDSAEFSTLGGWVATRASGMRKNRYGNIEQIVRRIKCVTPLGTLEKNVTVPRISAGPDVHEFIMGSEGTYGVITEVVVRVSLKPKATTYGSMIFPDFESGVACMHEVAMRKAAPVSIRLVDNLQFQFGQALKPEVNNMLQHLKDKAKKWYVTKHLKFDPMKMVAATLLFEGSKDEIKRQEELVYKIAGKYGGMKAGEENGIRGYFLTYMIAYLRDFGFKYSFMSESFETSVPWDKVLELCTTVKESINEVAAEYNLGHEPFVSCRVTQVYDTGACVYFYFGAMWQGLADPIAMFSHVEHAARDAIIKVGGSLSHHHGIGKLRKHWMEDTVSPVGVAMLKGLKNTVDPQNIFANGNLIDL